MMEVQIVRPGFLRVKAPARAVAVLVFSTATTLAMAPAAAGGAAIARLPVPIPTVSDFQYLASGQTPPTEANCFSVNRRCFTPTSMQNSYNLGPLYAAGHEGQGVTIAIVDSFGDPNIASDLATFDTQMGLQHMCGETGGSCGGGAPTFQHVYFNGTTIVKAPPSGSSSVGIQTRNVWALETALDVEWAHSIAPQANIINVTTNPAETLGVQGFPAMMDAEQYIVDNHLADVISQSFASAEQAFASTQSLLNLRHAFISAAASGVTVLGSSGDGGTANSSFTPVANPSTFPYPTVQWPASDPLVTGVGGTYLCTDPVTGTTIDNTDPPGTCKNQPNREIGWIASGGGFSSVFSRPSYQDTLPAGSTAIGPMRGVPDVSYQASSRTGVLVYDTAPGDATGGLNCSPGNPCSAGWYVVGGTSSSCPQWAALVAIADQIAGHGLGLINPKLYAIAANPVEYAADFYDVTTGKNQTDPSIPGYPATTGWDPVTGLGTPNAAALLPDLAS
ncbi:MAG TPA: S53 family peptidase [Streptosporangiaceae bacterium]